MNFYKRYYADKSSRISTHTKAMNNGRGKLPLTDKQWAYFKDLETFLINHGVYDGFRGNPRNRRECQTTINALKTIMAKNNLWEEWNKQKDGGDHDAAD